MGIKCCLISGSVAGSYIGSKLGCFAHVCTVSALSDTCKSALECSNLLGRSKAKVRTEPN